MNSYFSVIAFVRGAAYLTEKALSDPYAYLGALSQNRDLGEYPPEEADGIGDVPAKARSFNFGMRCGRVFYEAIERFTDDEIILADIAAAKVFLLDLDSPAAKSIIESTPLETLIRQFERIIRSFVKHAQIETPTAKPGNEDINAWFTAYDDLRTDFLRSVPDFARSMIMEPSDFEREFARRYIDPRDPVISLVTSQKTVNQKRLVRALEGNTSVFGAALAAVIKNFDVVR